MENLVGTEQFPWLASPADLILVDDEGPLLRERLFALLSDIPARAAEGGVEMSSTTCLLFSQGWVVKTRQTDKSPDLAALKAQVARSVELTRRIAIWHPAKAWFIFHDGENYWPCSVTPRLIPITQLPDERGGSSQASEGRGWCRAVKPRGISLISPFFEKMQRGGMWRQRLRLCLVHRRMALLMATSILLYHVALDPNPSNYGIEQGKTRVYYMDDEVYAFSSWKELARWDVRVLS
ncbi:MAG: hypothetical protein M5U01_14975 [Ardenticatenaceae bacterium]|nr:hypothetical protein [Ardenticatenaceae bacterium]